MFNSNRFLSKKFQLDEHRGTSCNVSDHPKCQGPGSRLQEFKPPWVKVFPHLEYGDYTFLTHAPMPMQCFISVMGQSR